ncbi:MAG: hypothetical protein VXV96_14665 [Bdellovibrionota bacterium]|nr:hypothetical protein [Bdellovibrionota bacterium]
MTILLTIIVFIFAIIAWLAGVMTGASFIFFYIVFPFAYFQGWIKFDYSKPFGMSFKTVKTLFRESLKTRELISYMSAFGMHYHEVLKLLFGLFVKSLATLLIAVSVLAFMQAVAPEAMKQVPFMSK